jgi:hypothetical protein
VGAALTICHKTFVLVVLALIVSSRAWAQDLSALAGTWILDPNTNDGRHLLARVAVVGPNPSTLAIHVSASRVILYKGSTILNREGYRLDGSETEVGGERRGTAAIENGNLVLTIRHTRPDAGTNVFNEIYSVSGKVLIIERQLSVIQPDGTIRENIPSYAHAVVYGKQ